MSSILDRLKSLAVTVEADLPAGVQKLTVMVEQHAATAADALKREAVAIENAVTPEVESYIAKLETSIKSHASALAHLFETHTAAALAAPADARAPAAPTSEAVPTAPVF